MKKELIAGISLLVIFVSCIVNIVCINNLADELIALVGEAENEAAAENWDNASQKVDEAFSLMERNSLYTSIVLPNDTLNSTNEALHELAKEIKAQDIDSTKAAVMLAEDKLQQLADMEQISFKSVF